MLESTASAVSNTVGLEGSFSTTLYLQRIGTLKCMYFDNIAIIVATSLKIFQGRILDIYHCVYLIIID